MNKEKLKRLYSEARITPKKYTGDKGQTIVVLPSPVQKKDFSDYKYAANIDEKIVDLASKLAERMAVAMVRESLNLNTDKIVESIADRIIPELGEKISKAMGSIKPQIIADDYRTEARDSIKKEIKEFVFDKPELSIDRAQGIEIKGEIGKKTISKDDISEDLDALDKLL